MSEITPFRDMASKLARSMDYYDMASKSDRVRSHGWWRNLVEHGAWKGPGSNRVGPPTPETFPGIATLFGVTPDEVRAMVAADWYQVMPTDGLSSRAQQLTGAIDRLDPEDADLIEAIIKRLDKDYLDKFIRTLPE